MLPHPFSTTNLRSRSSTSSRRALSSSLNPRFSTPSFFWMADRASKLLPSMRQRRRPPSPMRPQANYSRLSNEGYFTLIQCDLHIGMRGSLSPLMIGWKKERWPTDSKCPLAWLVAARNLTACFSKKWTMQTPVGTFIWRQDVEYRFAVSRLNILPRPHTKTSLLSSSAPRTTWTTQSLTCSWQPRTSDHLRWSWKGEQRLLEMRLSRLSLF